MMVRIVAGLWFLLVGTVGAMELPAATDLARDARESARTHAPILLFFTSRGCTYCEQVEQLHLVPMFQRYTDASYLLMRRVPVDEAVTIIDFEGRAVAASEFARAAGIRITPVVRLYGSNGMQLVPELLGYNSPDFYADYLERRIGDAQRRLSPRE